MTKTIHTDDEFLNVDHPPERVVFEREDGGTVAYELIEDSQGAGDGSLKE